MSLENSHWNVSPLLKEWLDSLPGSKTKILDEELRFQWNFDTPVPDTPGPDGQGDGL